MAHPTLINGGSELAREDIHTKHLYRLIWPFASKLASIIEFDALG